MNQRKDEITAEIEKILQEKQRKYLDVVEKMNANMKSLQQKKNNLSNELDQKLELAAESFKKEEESLKNNLIQLKFFNEEKSAAVRDRVSKLKKQIEEVNEVQIPGKLKEYVRCASILGQLQSKNSDKQIEIDSAKCQIQEKAVQINELDERSRLRSEELARMKFEIKRMKDELVNQETKRRTLHAQLQDLKGNIRVFCRIRALPDNL